MLRAVEDQQGFAALERLAQALEAVDGLRQCDAQRERNRRRQVVDGLERLERDQRRGRVWTLLLAGEQFQREARLANARRAHERHQPLAREQALHRLELGAAADELSSRRHCRAPRNGGPLHLARGAVGRSGCGVRDRQVQAVAETRHGPDRSRTQHAAQGSDLRRQIVLVDHESRPDALDQHALGDEPARILGEHEQEIEGPRSQLDGMASGEQLPLGRVQVEGPDPYQVHAATL
jgi:hypothetical protein